MNDLIFKRKKGTEDIDKKKRDKVMELYSKKTPMIDIKRQTGLSTEVIREIVEKYLQDEAEMNALDTQIKEKFSKRQLVAEPPYLVMKIIKEKDKKGKWQRRKVYTQQLLSEPSSEAEFMDFVMLYGDGTYSVLDKNKRLIKHIGVDNVAGFGDPTEIEEEKEEEEEEGYDYSLYPYPHQQPYPSSQYRPPKGKGKKHDALTQQAYQALQQQDYHINLKRRMAEIATEQGKIELANGLLKEVEKLEQQSGLAPEEREAHESIEREDYTITKKRKIADILMKRGETERANNILDEITKMENEKRLSFDEREAQKGMEEDRRRENILLKMAERYNAQGNAKEANRIMRQLGYIDDKSEVTATGFEKIREIVELQRGFGDVAKELGWRKGPEEKSKAHEFADIANILMKSGRENIIEPIKSYFTGEEEADEELLSELRYSQPRQSAPQQRVIQQISPPIQPQQSNEVVEGTIIPKKIQQQQKQSKIESDAVESEDLFGINEEEELKEADDIDEPITQEELMQPTQENFQPERITKLTIEHRYIINKVFPLWKACILRDVDPIRMAQEAFRTMTTLPGKLFVGKKRLVKIYKASKSGYDYFIKMWTPYVEKMDVKFETIAKELVEHGEEIFRSFFKPPKGMSSDKAIKIIKKYIKFKSYWTVFASPKGRDWIEIYQKTMFDLLDAHLRKLYEEALREYEEEMKEYEKEKREYEEEMKSFQPSAEIEENEEIIEEKIPMSPQHEEILKEVIEIEETYKEESITPFEEETPREKQIERTIERIQVEEPIEPFKEEINEETIKHPTLPRNNELKIKPKKENKDIVTKKKTSFFKKKRKKKKEIEGD